MSHRLLRASVIAVFAALTLVRPALAGPPRVETAFFEGHVVHFIQPAVFSNDPNGGVFACFGLGPDLSKTSRAANAPTLYVILNDWATQDHCDGDPTALRHDHVLTTAPGSAGYTGSWTLVLAVPGPSFDPAAMPFTTTAAVEQAVASGALVLVPTGASMIAPVIGGS